MRRPTVTLPPIEGARRIPLTMGLFAVVDDADYETLARFNWQAKKATNAVYAGRSVIVDGKKRVLWMHHVILSPPEGKRIDHADRDGLNNRRSNLRPCTSSQNTRNRVALAAKSSRWKGVHYNKSWPAKPWRARIGGGRDSGGVWRNLNLGSYRSEEQAARAYDAAALKLFGEFAALNFPP